MNTGYTSLSNSGKEKHEDLRTQMERVSSRVHLLCEPDRTLVRMYLDNNNSFRQIANLTGVNQATAARRLKRIIVRLSSDDVELILKSRKELSRKQRRIVRDYFVRGLTAKKTAQKHGTSYYNVLKTINHVKKLTGRKYKTTVRNY